MIPTRRAQQNSRHLMVTIVGGFAVLETSKQNSPQWFLRNSQERSHRQTTIKIPLNFQIAAVHLALDDFWDNGCQIHIIECEYRHCWLANQALSRILLLTICPASEEGAVSQC